MEFSIVKKRVQSMKIESRNKEEAIYLACGKNGADGTAAHATHVHRWRPPNEGSEVKDEG